MRQTGGREFGATHFPSGPNQIQVIVQDVTRTRHAERALRESEDHYRTAVALNPEVPWLADPHGDIIEFGPRWLEMVDTTRKDTLGEGLLYESMNLASIWSLPVLFVLGADGE